MDITGGSYDFKSKIVQITLKQMCISVQGVKLWTSLDEDLKKCPTLNQFKILYKKKNYVLHTFDLMRRKIYCLQVLIFILSTY